MTTALPRIAVTKAQIAQVVTRFYANVRAHPVLGPIFHESITQDAALWTAHEAKITRFWRNALLREPVYDGNPMLVHSGISAIQPAHFAIWLGLFDETLRQTLPNAQADAWSVTAHRIGRGLSLGLETTRARRDAIPDLLG